MKRSTIPFLFLTSFALSVASVLPAARAAELPKALIIGDSISIGYTPYVKEALEGTVEVRHHKGNAQHTATGLKMLERWIGDEEWDVIHFNWGLWDLCYRHPDSKIQGKRDKVNGTLTTTLEQYGKNLEQLVARLKKTGAKLIWASTTVIPPEEAGRKLGDATRYNRVAGKIMEAHGVAVDDLHALTETFEADLFVKPGDVHFTKEGYQRIAEQVSREISETVGDGQATQGKR